MAEPRTFEETYAEPIRERMAAGLTRDQAIAVQKAQNEWDEAQRTVVPAGGEMPAAGKAKK
jgi:hypothetical protein